MIFSNFINSTKFLISCSMTKVYPVQEGEVYTSAGTKLNVYEKQKAELREIARNDPNHFYTYSADYLSLSIDPYAPEDIKRIEEENKQKVNIYTISRSNFLNSYGKLHKASRLF